MASVSLIVSSEASSVLFTEKGDSARSASIEIPFRLWWSSGDHALPRTRRVTHWSRPRRSDTDQGHLEQGQLSFRGRIDRCPGGSGAETKHGSVSERGNQRIRTSNRSESLVSRGNFSLAQVYREGGVEGALLLRQQRSQVQGLTFNEPAVDSLPQGLGSALNSGCVNRGFELYLPCRAAGLGQNRMGREPCSRSAQ